MTFLEAISSPEAKAKFREMVKKYHPDNKETGNNDKMVKINSAEEKGDRAIDALYDELVGGKKSEKETWEEYKKRASKEKPESQAEKKEEKPKETILQKKSKIEQWLRQPEFLLFFNKYNLAYRVDISESKRIYIVVKTVKNHRTITLFTEDIDTDRYHTSEHLFYLIYVKSIGALHKLR